jgi:hypothetical protein
MDRLKGRISEFEMIQAYADAEQATEGDLRSWTYRALFHSRWPAIASRSSELSGVALIRFDFLISSAIHFPLETWCLRLLYFSPRRDDEWDTNVLLMEAPWLRDCFEMVGSLVDELQDHRSALIACDSEDLARGLFLASQQQGRPRRRHRRTAVQLYSDRGCCVACG